MRYLVAMIGLARLAFDWRQRRIIVSRGRVRTRNDSTASGGHANCPKCTVREDARAQHALGGAPAVTSAVQSIRADISHGDVAY